MRAMAPPPDDPTSPEHQHVSVNDCSWHSPPLDLVIIRRCRVSEPLLHAQQLLLALAQALDPGRREAAMGVALETHPGRHPIVPEQAMAGLLGSVSAPGMPASAIEDEHAAGRAYRTV